MATISEGTLQHMQEKAAIWLNASKTWTWVYWLTNLLGVSMSCLAASTVAKDANPYFSVVAAICFGVNGFANPQKRAARHVRGYLILDDAILRAEDGLITVEDLHSARGKAESEIHGSSEPTPPPTDRDKE